jgi:hypothetical protein
MERSPLEGIAGERESAAPQSKAVARAKYVGSQLLAGRARWALATRKRPLEMTEAVSLTRAGSPPPRVQTGPMGDILAPIEYPDGFTVFHVRLLREIRDLLKE